MPVLSSRHSSRPLRALAFALAAVALAANLANLLFLDYFGPLIALPWMLGTFSGVGLVVALRQQQHPIGWLFLTAGMLFAVALTSSAYGWTALVAAPGSLPLGEIAIRLSSMLYTPALGAVFVAVLLFPTGRLPSARWRPVLWGLVGVIGAVVVVSAFAPHDLFLPTAFSEGPDQLGDPRTIPNPMAVGGTVGAALLLLQGVLDALPPLLFLLVVAAAIVRYRNSRGVERIQMRWFTYAASLAIGLLVLSFGLPRGIAADLAWLAGVSAFALIPVATGIAVLRYRLYDIDVLINRTIVYAALTAALGATYVGGVIGAQALLGRLTAGSEIAVAGSTLLVVALFQPLRRRIQDAVDHRFYRSRYDAERTVEAFAERLRDNVDLDELRGDLVDVAARTLAPQHAGLWLRRGDRPG